MMFCDAGGGHDCGRQGAPLGVSTAERLAAHPTFPPSPRPASPDTRWPAGYDCRSSKDAAADVDKLHEELKSVIASPALQEQINKLSLVPLPTPSIEDMQGFVKTEIARWGKIVEQAGIAGSE